MTAARKGAEESERYANEIRLRAERRLGEITASMERASGRRTDKPLPRSVEVAPTKAEALRDVGIAPQEATRFEAIAAVPEEVFEAEVVKPEASTARLARWSAGRYARRTWWWWRVLAMGFCTGCGATLRDEDAFCGKCGRAVASVPLVQASASAATASSRSEGADGDSEAGEFAADQALAARESAPLEPGTPRALRFEGHMLAAGLLHVGVGAMVLVGTLAGLVADQSPSRGSLVVPALAGLWLVVEGLGLRLLRGWARVMAATHAVGALASLALGRVELRGTSGLFTAVVGAGIPLAVAIMACTAPANAFTRAYRESPARLDGPKATPYRSPFFAVACMIAVAGFVILSYAFVG